MVAQCQNAGLTPNALALATGTPTSAMSYCLRAKEGPTKRFAPPLDRLDAWCKHLKLSGEAKKQFYRLAFLEHMEPVIRNWVEGLEEQIARLEKGK